MKSINRTLTFHPRQIFLLLQTQGKSTEIAAEKHISVFNCLVNAQQYMLWLSFLSRASFLSPKSASFFLTNIL